MSDLGKMLTLLGCAIAAIGLVAWGLGRVGFRGLPGDLRYQGDHVRFYFPWVTCLVISVLATAALWFWRWFTSK